MSYQAQAESTADKPQTESGQDGEPVRSQTPASSPSALQLIANAFRRTFSVSNAANSSGTAVIMFVLISVLILYFKHIPKAAEGKIFLALFRQEDKTWRSLQTEARVRGNVQF